MDSASVECGIALFTLIAGTIGYFLYKRDDKIDAHDEEITELEKRRAEDVRNAEKNLSDFKLNVAENYATKVTVLALFQESNQNHREAIQRVEKQVENTNATIKDQSAKMETAATAQANKMEKMIDKIGGLEIRVMAELSKKT